MIAASSSSAKKVSSARSSMSLRMDVLRKILTRVARREVGDQSHVVVA
jgi:hypothetical protein